MPPITVSSADLITEIPRDPTIRIASSAGEIVASHRRAPSSAGQTVRAREHAAMLEKAVLQAFTTEHACRRKANRPPGLRALAELARLTGHEQPPGRVVSLADYQQLADARTAATGGTR